MVLKCKSRGGFNKAFFSDAKYFRMLNAVKNNPVGVEKKKDLVEERGNCRDKVLK